MTQYEKMGGTYRRDGDYILPNLEIAAKQDRRIGVWGERHGRYLKEHHKVRYYNLLTAGTLDDYLSEIESRAEELFEQTVKHLAEKENITEDLKANLSLEWVRKMNNIRNRAIEIVNTEVILV